MGYFIVSLLRDIFSNGPRWLSQHGFIQALPWIFGSGIVVAGVMSCLAWWGWVLPLKQDALSGKKIKKPYLILEKEYFPVTGQYTFHMKHPFYKLVTVDADIYDRYNDGDEIYWDTAIKSGYILGCPEIKLQLFEIKRGSRFDF